MQLLLRVAIGLIGVLGLLLVVQFLIDPAKAAGNLGLVGQGASGLSSLRSDVGGFFAGTALFTLAAAIQNSRRLLSVPLVFIAYALAARFVTIGLDGWHSSAIGPIVAEAALLAIVIAGHRKFARG
jgi:hypothetical protein